MDTVYVLGGPGGSGRTTIAKAFAKKYKLQHLYGGGLQRSIALQLGFGEKDPNTGELVFSEKSFLDYHENYRPTHPEIDLKIDAILFEQALQGEVVIESMTFGPLAKRLNLPFYKVWITADEDERVRRIVRREEEKGHQVTFDEMKKVLHERTVANQTAYQALYGFDYLDADFYYDITIDTTHTTYDQMLEYFEKKLTEKNLLPS